MNRLKVLISLLSATLLACPPVTEEDAGVDAGPTDPTMIVVPKGEGGLFIRDACTVQVPAGAFLEEQILYVTRVDDGIPEVPNFTRISHGCRLSPNDIEPQLPLIVFSTFDPEYIPAGVDPLTLELRRQHGDEAYAQLPGNQVSVADHIIPFNRVHAETDRAGVFWVVSPSQPNIDRVELEPATLDLIVGETAAVRALVLTPKNFRLDDVPVEFSIVPARVASISQTGLVTGLAPGIATVTATINTTIPPQTAKATVRVRGTTVGPVTFDMQNPWPTNAALHNVTPSPIGRIYSGANGTVLVEDGTGTFTRQASLPLATFYGVAGTSLANAVAVGEYNNAGIFVEVRNGTPQVRTFTTQQIRALTHVWFDGTSGLAIGGAGDNHAMYFINGQWVMGDNPTWEKVLALKGDGVGGFTLVGNKGSIYRYDPVTRVWDPLYESSLSTILQAATLLDVDGDAWAVSNNNTSWFLWRFTGSGWTSSNLPANLFAKATGIAIFDNNTRVAIVGEHPAPNASLGRILMRCLDLSCQNFAELRGQQTPKGVFVNDPAASGDAMEVRIVGSHGAVWRWDYTVPGGASTNRWREVSRGFQGDVVALATTATDVFAGVNTCTNARCTGQTGGVMHRGADGGYEPLGALPASATINSLVARNDEEVIVSTAGGSYRWNGTSWTAFPAPNNIRALTWCGEKLYGAVGDTVHSGDAAGFFENSVVPFPPMPAGGMAIPVAVGDGLRALHCLKAPDQVWAAGSLQAVANNRLHILSTLAERHEDGGWTMHSEEDTSSLEVNSDWMAVYSPGEGEALAFGDRTFGGYTNSAELLQIQGAPQVMIDVASAMWGSSFDNLYMTGWARMEQKGSGFLQRYNGVSWDLVDLGTEQRGLSLFGRSRTDIWAGTSGGGILKGKPPPSMGGPSPFP